MQQEASERWHLSSGKGKRVCRKVREGVDTGTGIRVVRKRVLSVEWVGMLGLGEWEAGKQGC